MQSKGYVDNFAYSSIFLTSGIFSAYNAAWLVDRGFSLSDVSLIQSVSLVFNLFVPALVIRQLRGKRCSKVIVVLAIITFFAYLTQGFLSDTVLIIALVAIAYFMWSLIIPINEIGASNSSKGDITTYSKYRIVSALAGFIGGLLLLVYSFLGIVNSYIASLLSCYVILVLLNLFRGSETIATSGPTGLNFRQIFAALADKSSIAIIPFSFLIGILYVLYIHYTVLSNDRILINGGDVASILWNVAFLSEILAFILVYRWNPQISIANALILCALVTFVSLFTLYLSLVVKQEYAFILALVGMLFFGFAYAFSTAFAFHMISNLGDGEQVVQGFALFYALNSGLFPLLIYFVTYVFDSRWYDVLILASATLTGLMCASLCIFRRYFREHE